MSTQRYIDVSFYDDAWVQELDPSEKFMYMYLLTNPLTNIAGVYKITAKRMSFDTGFNIDTVRHIISKFCTAGKVYQKDEYIIIKNWCKHQKIESGNSSKISNVKIGIDKILKELPDDILLLLKEIDYSYIYLNDVLQERGLEGLTRDSNYLNLNLNLDLNSNSSNSSAPSISDLPPVSETTSEQALELMNRIAELESKVKEQEEEIKDRDILINENNKVIESMSKKKSSKSTSTSKFSNKDYDECLKIINDNKIKLLKEGKDIDSTNYALPHMKKLLKHQFEYYGVENTKKGLVNSLLFTWLVDTSRYSMNALFSDKVFPKLISCEFGDIKQPNSNTKKSGGINYTGQTYDGEVF